MVFMQPHALRIPVAHRSGSCRNSREGWRLSGKQAPPPSHMGCGPIPAPPPSWQPFRGGTSAWGASVSFKTELMLSTLGCCEDLVRKYMPGSKGALGWLAGLKHCRCSDVCGRSTDCKALSQSACSRDTYTPGELGLSPMNPFSEEETEAWVKRDSGGRAGTLS